MREIEVWQRQNRKQCIKAKDVIRLMDHGSNQSSHEKEYNSLNFEEGDLYL